MLPQRITNFQLEQLTSGFLPCPRPLKFMKNQVMNQVMFIMKKRLRCFDRFVLNIDKPNFIITSNVECYAYLKDDNRKIQDILDEIKIVLIVLDEITITNIKTTSRSVKFSVNGYDFELIPAIDLIKNTSSQTQVGLECQKYALEVVNNAWATETCALFKNSFFEPYLQFLNAQCDYTNNLIKLCSLWDHSIFFQDYFPERSKIIELVAIKAANQQCAFGTMSLDHGFRLFLDEMENLDSISLTFLEYWPYLPRDPLEIHSIPPVILDPVNPYHNLGNYLSSSIMQTYKEIAAGTISRISKHKQDMEMSFLHELFNPQPIDLMKDRRPVPRNILCRVETDRRELVPTIIGRKRSLNMLKAKELLILEILKMRVHNGLVCFTARSDKRPKKILVLEYAQSLITQTILSKSISWSTYPANHETREFTVVWPYKHFWSKKPKFLVLSFDLK